MTASKGKERASSPPSSPSEEAHCLICLGEIQNRTVLAECLHSCFCFECIARWAELKRLCPLCQRPVGRFVIHSIREDSDYAKYYLPSPKGEEVIPRQQLSERITRRHAHRVDEEQRRVDLALSRRKEIYRQGLYVKHVGSNKHTRYRPITLSQMHHHHPRIAAFIRRDLQAWPNVDVEFLTTYTLSIMKRCEIKSQEAVTLLADFLGKDGASHFVHEVDSFVRSGRRTLKDYDEARWTQYPEPSMRVEVARRRERLLVRLEEERRLLHSDTLPM